MRAGEVNALAASDTIAVPRCELLWLASELDCFLDRLAREVRENKNVMLASQFCRWLQFSGLVKILERLPAVKEPVPFDAKVLRKKVDDLLYECGELFRGGKADPKYAASDIAEINRKLDLLMKCVRGSNDSQRPVELLDSINHEDYSGSLVRTVCAPA